MTNNDGVRQGRNGGVVRNRGEGRRRDTTDGDEGEGRDRRRRRQCSDIAAGLNIRILVFYMWKYIVGAVLLHLYNLSMLYVEGHKNMNMISHNSCNCIE